MFNEAMACNACWVMKAVVTECAQFFRGLQMLADVGGGTGIAARIITEAFLEGILHDWSDGDLYKDIETMQQNNSS
uniref:8-hydroxyquercetin 8-O-methyltransferase-like n=1 Tax=Elaeis guineensis var. tenera TaxID=51953 RepID=A0A8N4EWA1_ELAGV|nr:8-hydroxyquercetin 8-O-methyltransferase-like [Elaeis guineensis]